MDLFYHRCETLSVVDVEKFCNGTKFSLVLLPQPVKLYSKISSMRLMMVNISSATGLLPCEDVSSEKLVFSRIFMCLNRQIHLLEIFIETEAGKEFNYHWKQGDLKIKVRSSNNQACCKMYFFYLSAYLSTCIYWRYTIPAVLLYYMC